MRNVSTKYLQAMENRRDFYPEAEITFLDGVKKTLDKNDFFIAGNSIIDSAESSSFPLGILVSKRITISIVNDDDRWADYSFTWAKIFLKTKFDLDDGTTETLNIGTFTVVTPETYGSTIQITAMDDCYKTDVEYSSDLPFPASARVALQDSCTTCGITLKTLSFANDDFVIPAKPENITHRQFIGMIAMLAGGNARMDEYNRLMIMSYDFRAFEQDGLDGGVFDDGNPLYESGDTASGGSFNPWDTGDVADGGQFGDRNNIHILYDYKTGIKIEADDVVITGVQMVDENKEVYLFGNPGYVLQLENRLAEGKESEAVQLIGQKIVGLTFRPFSGDHIAYPMAEFMDLAYIFDYKNNMYQTVLTDVNFTYNGFTSMKCAADSPVRNSSKYYGNEVKAIIEARKMVKDERTEREKALEVLANELAHSSGLYITPDVQPDGSTIYYMHNKSSLGESDIVWKLTAEAIGISTDGGKTYPVGVDATGMAILNRIYTIGLNADYITTGAFEIRKGDKVMVLMDKDTGEVILRPDTFELSNGDTIDSIAEGKADKALSDAKQYADTAASGAVNAQTQEDIFNKLTNGGKNKGIYMQDGELYINMTYLQSGALKIIKDGKIIFLADAENKRVEIVADEFSLSNGDTLESVANSKANAALANAKSYADSAATNAVNKQTQEDIFNRLTNSGKAKGIILKNGELYVSATYINTGALKISKDGVETFYADVDTGEVRIKAASFSLESGDTIESIAESKASTAANSALGSARSYTDTTAQSTLKSANGYADTAASTAVNNFISKTYDPKIAELQKQLDGQIESFYYNYAPTLSNAPASSWSTDTERQKHEGDLFYNRTTGYAYRFFKDGATWKWQMIQDTDITKAIEDAAAAQDTADGKRRTFLTQPTPPYDKGDLWYGGTSAEVKVCTTARISGSYTPSDWTKQDKYIDQSAADAAASKAVNAQTQQDIFNKLTNNGTKQGIYLERGKLYLNAEYMATGVLQSHDRETFYLDLDNGVLKMKATELTIAGQSVNKALSDAVTSILQQYYQSNSATSLSGGSWGATQPAWIQGKYIWNRQYVTYGNGTHAYLPSENGVCITGNTGANGTNGTNGTNGKDGAPGKDGTNGANGTNGVSVSSVVAQYYQNTSYTSAPSQSYTWSETMPTVSSGYYIWCRQKVTYSNGNVAYTTPYCMTKTVGDIAQGKVDAQTQTDIFNKLTNNGSVKGIYMLGSQLYVSASYIDADTLSAISANLGTVTVGKLESSDYLYGGSGYFSSFGMMIDLTNKIIRTQNFYLKGDMISPVAVFRGRLEAATGSFSGKITATEGSIGGWTIGTDRITGQNGVELVPKNAAPTSLPSGTKGVTFISSNYVCSNNFYGIGANFTDINVTGSKKRIVDTANYSVRSLYCYEMPSPMFGDIGEAVTDENGKCYIYFDDIFSETISAEIEYQVFLQKEGPGDIWIAEKTPRYFVVQGTENLKFAWEIKAKQRDYEYERLDEQTRDPLPEYDYEQEYLDEIEALISEQEEILYEAA